MKVCFAQKSGLITEAKQESNCVYTRENSFLENTYREISTGPPLDSLGSFRGRPHRQRVFPVRCFKATKVNLAFIFKKKRSALYKALHLWRLKCERIKLY